MGRVLVVLGLCGSPAAAADWPQFLGPTRDSVSPEPVPAWAEPPEELWRRPVGEAHSSPVVAGGLVYAFYQPAGQDADALAAFDATTGERRWEKSYPRDAFNPPFGNGPRSTPAVAGGAVYTLGGTGVLAKWDAKTGDLAWKVDTLKEFKAPNLFFGVSTSPTVIGDKVVVMVGGKGHGVVAFDAATGNPAWAATDDPASYASPAVVGGDLVFLTGSHLRAVTAGGAEKWAVPFRDLLNESSTTPAAVGGLVVGSSVTAGSVAVRPAAGGPPEQVWKAPALNCYFSTPVAAGGHLYMVCGGGSVINPQVKLVCAEAATGKVTWTKEKVGKYHAALLKTGGGHLLMLGDRGRLTLFAADPAKFAAVAEAEVCGPTWAHPALAAGRLYVRDDKALVCLRVGE